MMKPYESYKETNIPWLSEIPSHWVIKRNKNLFSEVNIKNEEIDGNLLSVSQYTGVTERKSRSNKQGMHDAETLLGYKLVSKDNLVMNIMLAWNGSLGISNYNGVVSPAYAVFQAKQDINQWYYHYLFRCPHLTRYFKSSSTGVVESRLRLYPEDFFLLSATVPPREEQDQIVRYLDWKLSKINKLIKAKKKQIELLKEQKQAVINKAVTKGLDNTVPMKDSGIEWLGEVPEHWELCRLKTLGSAIIGLTYSPGNLVDKDNGTLVFRSSNIQNGKITYDDNVYVCSSIPDTLITKENDILICSRNGSRSLVGKCAIITENDVGNSFGAFTTVFRTDYAQIIYYILNSVVLKGVMGLFSTATINQLTTSILNAIVTPFPPVEEQQAIVTYLEEKTARTDKAITLIEKELELVAEYKTSLISSVVTGKVDVRDVVVPDFEVVQEVVEDTENEEDEMEE